MPRVGRTKVQYWITRAALNYPNALARALGAEFNVSKAAAARKLRELVRDGWLVRHGTTHPVYELGKNRLLHKTFQLPIEHEDLVWQVEFMPYLALSANAASLAFYCFTEMVNNATDHSNGTAVEITIRQTELETRITIQDNGIGIFRKIATALGLEDLRFSLLELSKGKLTTDPERHSGEGIFFSSRMCDQFIIRANGLDYFHAAGCALDVLNDLDHNPVGTMVWMVFCHDTNRTTTEVLNNYASDGTFAFDKTMVPVNLARIGTESLVSRSQAKRLMSRFENFRIVALDFNGVEDIGQAFADEVFRVFPHSHPSVTLVPINTTEQIRQMINRAKGAQSEPVPADS
jgi:hypothetical protein